MSDIKDKALALKIEKIHEEILKFASEHPEFNWMGQQLNLTLEKKHYNELDKMISVVKLLNDQLENDLITAIEMITKSLNDLNMSLDSYDPMELLQVDNVVNGPGQDDILAPCEKIKFVH